MNSIRVWGAATIIGAALAGQSFAVNPPASAANAMAPIAMAPIASAPKASGAAFDLVTQHEATAWNTAAPTEPQDFSTHDFREDGGVTNCHSASNNDADNPRIRILAPPLGRPLNSPLDIELKFIPTGSAPIRPESFRACYVGSVTMDITKRITDHATVSEHGLHVTGVRLPQGRHHLLLLIADQRGRLGRQEVQFDIE
jgi:hypothetical protein